MHVLKSLTLREAQWTNCERKRVKNYDAAVSHWFCEARFKEIHSVKYAVGQRCPHKTGLTVTNNVKLCYTNTRHFNTTYQKGHKIKMKNSYLVSQLSPYHTLSSKYPGTTDYSLKEYTGNHTESCVYHPNHYTYP